MISRDKIKTELLKHIDEGEEIFLEPLFDLSAAFANDIQGKHFWPYYPEFVDSFGGAFLKIKDNPENIQAGYVALAQMVRMIMRSVDQEENEIKSLEVLQISLNGLTKEKKLPVHSYKLCASAFGQIIRRSKTKVECITFMLEKCTKNPELAAHILIRALKTTEKALHEDANKNWEIIVDTIGINNNSSIWNHLINIIAELTKSENIKSFMEILLTKWIEKIQELDTNSMYAKFEVINKILQLCRGKKIKIEKFLTDLICALVSKYSKIVKDDTFNDQFISNLTECVSKLCSVPNQQAIECIEDFINSNIDVKDKITILSPITKIDHFEAYFKPNIVRTLMKSPNSVCIENLILHSWYCYKKSKRVNFHFWHFCFNIIQFAQ